MMRGCRNLHKEELRIFLLPDRIGMIKSRSMRLTNHVACMGEKSTSCRTLVGKLKERPCYEDVD
jgi:hypothetical protein